VLSLSNKQTKYQKKKKKNYKNKNKYLFF